MPCFAARGLPPRIVLDHIRAGDPADAVLLVGDFNAGPDAPTRRLFAEVGLRETAALAGKRAAPTYQFYGVRLGSLDGILAGRGWRVSRHAVVDVKPGGVFPADLTLSPRSHREISNGPKSCLLPRIFLVQYPAAWAKSGKSAQGLAGLLWAGVGVEWSAVRAVLAEVLSSPQLPT
ncbi:MAG: hypothetical protein L0Z62_47805 [Gemmataceae bacterium]|nr:hypothetical protein [Gemmataceae bacterium]